MPKPSVSNISSAEQKLDQIIGILEHMNKRDRLRTWGAFFRSILQLIPIILIIWSTWYAFAHWDTLLQEVSKAAAEQSAAVMQNQGGDFSKQLQEQMQKMMQKK